MISKLLKKNFIRYLLTGGFSFAVDYLSLLFLYRILKVELVIATSTGFILALLVNFFINKFWTFESRSGGHRQHTKEAASYLLLVGVNFIFTNFVVLKLASIGIGPAISKFITVGCITLWNYYLYKKYIFKSSQEVTDFYP